MLSTPRFCGQIKGTEAKKIYRLKEDQAFWLSLELGGREKVARHPSADFLPSPTCPPPHLYLTDKDAPSVLGGGGKNFVDTIIAVTTMLILRYRVPYRHGP